MDGPRAGIVATLLIVGWSSIAADSDSGTEALVEDLRRRSAVLAGTGFEYVCTVRRYVSPDHADKWRDRGMRGLRFHRLKHDPAFTLRFDGRRRLVLKTATDITYDFRLRSAQAGLNPQDRS